MKKNTLQKTIALALTGAMAMGTLAGCGNSSDTSASTSTDTKTEAASTEAAATTEASTEASDEVAGIDGYEAFADNVTLRIPVYDRGVEGVPDVSNNYWTKWVQENFGDKYNITVEYVPITRSDV